MSPFVLQLVTSFLLASIFSSFVSAQNGDGYIGYRLEKKGDPDSAIYETADTPGGVGILPEDPDVMLNASVHVGEINIEVDNLTAKINLDARVLNLLHFTAGVDASVDRVRLNIQNVNAKVYLEARLENVVAMVDDVLRSIDLNPIIATLGNTIGDVVGNITDGIGGGGGSESGSDAAASEVRKRAELNDYKLAHNILYSVNDYQGNTHTNRILGQDGTIYDMYINNFGAETGRKAVGDYRRDMTFTGHNRTITPDEGEEGPIEYELGYYYNPYVGLDAYAHIFVDTGGAVLSTKLVTEADGGGTSTIGNNEANE